tara:strand:- start:156 stop:569 length:414 start_codon:yes stop_codon:yes gene_type:complete
MTPQNPFDTWGNSDEDLNLQKQIADIQMQQENLMRTDHRGMSMEAKSQMSEKLSLFDLKINELNGKLGKGKMTPFSTGQNPQMFNQPKTTKSFSANGVSFPNGGQIPQTMSASERKLQNHWIKSGGKLIPNTPQFNF